MSESDQAHNHRLERKTDEVLQALDRIEELILRVNNLPIDDRLDDLVRKCETVETALRCANRRFIVLVQLRPRGRARELQQLVNRETEFLIEDIKELIDRTRHNRENAIDDPGFRARVKMSLRCDAWRQFIDRYVDEAYRHTLSDRSITGEEVRDAIERANEYVEAAAAMVQLLDRDLRQKGGVK